MGFQKNSLRLVKVIETVAIQVAQTHEEEIGDKCQSNKAHSIEYLNIDWNILGLFDEYDWGPWPSGDKQVTTEDVKETT